MSAHNFIDLTGKTFGFLTVISQAERSNPKVARWNCECLCGAKTTVAGKHLRDLKITSCGCRKRNVASEIHRTHGQTNSDEYKVWCGIKRRCYNENEKSFPRYGGAGVRMCSRWRESFEDFLKDMGKRPTPSHSIDRINGTGDYEPDNCRWALDRDQNRNRKSNVYLSFGGETLIVADWATRIGISPGTLRVRLSLGWSVERALTEPLRSSKRVPNAPGVVVNPSTTSRVPSIRT